MENYREDKFARKKLKKTFFLIALACFLGLAIFLSHGKRLSDALKDIIVPELESMTGQKVTVRTIHINLFPLFIDAKELKVFDQEGKDILIAKRAKGYVDLTGIFSKNLTIRRLVITDPGITTNRNELEDIVRHVRTYLETERKTAFKVKVKVIEIVKGDISFSDEELKGTAGIRGFSGEVMLGETQRLNASIKEMELIKEGWPKILCNINTSIVLKGDRIDIKLLEIGSYGSRFRGEGFYSKSGGILKSEVTLLVDSVKRMFKLGRKGEGRISVKGNIRVEREEKQPSIYTDRLGPQLKLQAGKSKELDLKDLVVELKLGGDFYLETLMELLKVSEKLEGLVDFQGEITGRLANITGKAKARLRKGNLYDIDIDSLNCDVLYQNGVMKFQHGNGFLYNGTAQADVTINLPVVNFFTVKVIFQSIDSKPVLKLIGWEPEIPLGKVDGELATSGSEFNPDGWFVFKSLSAEQKARIKGYRPPVDDFLNKIRNIKGNYSLRGDILALSNLQLFTSISNISADGNVDIVRKTLALKGRLHSDNVSDLTFPYYREATGRGDFSGEISGPFDNPTISGKVVLSNPLIEGYRTESIVSDITYQKNLLDLRDALCSAPGEEHGMRGKVHFPQAKELFELANPVYDLSASLKNAEFGQFVKIFYKDFSAEGKLHAEIKIRGPHKDVEVSGNASVDNGFLYNIRFDSASGGVSYARRWLDLTKVTLRKGKSIFAGDGKIGFDKNFVYKVSSEKCFLKDFVSDRITIPDDATLKIRSDGRGSFDNPVITVSANVTGGTFKGRNIGGGTLNASVRNRDILVDAALFDEKMKLKGKGYLNEKLPWSAELSIESGRYDFLISSFLKEVPEDLQLNLEGSVGLKGDRKNIAATANIHHAALSLFGQTFTNEQDIKFSVENKKISVREFITKSGSAAFKLQGGMDIGREYDVRLAGTSSLSPLKAFSKKVGYLKGDADFTLSVKGKWEKPLLSGSMNISNASFGMKDYSTYISSINGSVYMEDDKIVLKALSGKAGGGTIHVSGIVYLDAFLMKRFYLEAKLHDVTATVSKDFHINFDGDLLSKGSKEAMSIIGDVKINRSKYKEPIEWKSWLFSQRSVEKPQKELSAIERADLNIRITGSENISIDNNIARTPIKIAGEMLVKGTIAKPVFFGRFETAEGYAYFRNNEFRIISASVDLIDPNRIKPVVNLTAETTVKGYRIRLNLEGQMDRYNLSLLSEPHLEDRDILSLLTAGQTGKQLKGLEGGIGAGEATSLLTGKLQDVVEERLKTITGVDRFQVEPSVSSTTGTVGPRVTVSKRLVGDKLFVTYANLIGTTEEQVIKIEYLLNRNVSLVGIRDEKGSLGGDVRFRFEFK
jgi:hypothetical protein